MCVVLQEAMRRSSSSAVVRRLQAALAEEGELRAVAVVRYRKEMLQRKAMYDRLMQLKGNIRVYCRVRPLLDVAPPVATTGIGSACPNISACCRESRRLSTRRSSRAPDAPASTASTSASTMGRSRTGVPTAGTVLTPHPHGSPS